MLKLKPTQIKEQINNLTYLCREIFKKTLKKFNYTFESKYIYIYDLREDEKTLKKKIILSSLK